MVLEFIIFESILYIFGVPIFSLIWRTIILFVFTLLFSARNNCQGNDICAICLENLTGFKKLLNLECNHTFHRECIITLEKCPLCRALIQ